ncbi:hypothetical protein GCM10022243_57130 [Saccharothrix violaceirubra]|uniref:Glyoxalase/fosfomycin resistance/dioxygenase domain-containing protein n=1 Tax=Saccharothrix violaceirubra TaxID=413306 RepID=A0A7W7WVZ0_9PSEU|nr:VOC family protein [Saccharothrix violaceirubra]MBB4965854.1 hypothetical protein [Saccharothrix violaceirubra]
MSHPQPTRGVRRLELTTPDPEPVADFYATLLGWTVLAEPDGSFTGWVGDRLATHVRPHSETAWRIVFAAGRPRELRGGAATDTGRALHGPWAPTPRPGEPAWLELHGVPAADDPYWTDELGCRPRTPDADYTVYETGADQRPLAARHTSAEGGWLAYFAVTDATAVLDTARGLDATILVDPRPTPSGTAAALSDPAGAVFAVLEKPAVWGGTS